MQIISDHTITTGSVTQKLLGGLKTAGPVRAACSQYAVQNKDVGATLYIKTGTANSTANNTTDSISVLPGEYKIIGPIHGGNVYDVDQVFIYSTLGTHAYAVERVIL